MLEWKLCENVLKANVIRIQWIHLPAMTIFIIVVGFAARQTSISVALCVLETPWINWPNARCIHKRLQVTVTRERVVRT